MRRINESLMINDDIEITVISMANDKVKLCIKPPREIAVHRKEIY